MTRTGLRRFGPGPLAGAGSAALVSLVWLAGAGLAVADTDTGANTAPSFPVGGPVANPFACLPADVAECAIVFGGSGIPIPHQDYVDAVNERFIQPDHPGAVPQALFTPEGLQPFTAIKDLPLDTSMARGLALLDAAIKAQLAAGQSVVVYGYSQSATISSLEMRNLLALPADQRPSPDRLFFTMIGDPNAPNGGLLSRFYLPELRGADGNGPTIPALGVTFDGATPDGSYSNTITSLEYDGFADFPRYPLNLLADLNAVAGIVYVHDQYPMLTPAQLDAAVTLPTEGPTNTVYKMVETADLPLLQPLRAIPLVGGPLADLLQPDLRVLINLGYGSPDVGWSTGPANLLTTFGLFPADVNWAEVARDLAAGAQQGITDAAKGVASATSLSSALDVPTETPTPVGDLADALSGALASAYSVLLPTADIANSLLTTLPAYATQIFVAKLAEGDVLDAFGLPVAAAVGLASVAAGFELISIEHGISGVSAAFDGSTG